LPPWSTALLARFAQLLAITCEIVERFAAAIKPRYSTLRINCRNEAAARSS
jgi:hypothetical protein